MPIPLAIPLVMAGIQLGTSIYKGIKANKEKKEALNAINSYQRKERKNVFKDQPWYNSQAQLEAKNQLKQNQATSVSAAMQGGAKTYGIIEGAQRQADEATLKLNADVQDKYLSHTDRVAQDDARLQAMTQADEQQDISGLASLYEAGRQDEATAITEGGQALAFAGASVGESIGSGGKSTSSTGVDANDPVWDADASGYIPKGEELYT